MKCLNEESRVFGTLLSLYLNINRRKLHGEPTRPAGQPTPKGRLGVCKRMQADAKGEKPMQADAKRCKRKSKEARVKEKGARGKQGQTSPKGAKGKSLGGFSVVSLSVGV